MTEPLEPAAAGPAAVPVAEVAAFDLAGELPTRTTLLEASAGTGKTYAIAALASRYVAEGRVPLTDMLLITFTRTATRELRERIRDRLLWTREILADPAAARQHPDPVVQVLAAGSDAAVAKRRDRLVVALATFDSATIATTHEFCGQMLASLGIGADADPVETHVDDLSELCREVADDLYVRQFGARDANNPPEVSYDDATTIAGKVVADPIASLAAGPVPPGTQAEARQRFAESVRAEVERRRRERSLVSYDDMIGRLAAALRGGAADANRRRLRERYRLVMVDEFQDTDALQWQILADAFHGQCDLILIGDPKQAIYGFRGGDVFTYLQAGEVVHHRATLRDNWRSDAGLVGDLGRLFGPVALGDERIRVRQVHAQQDGRLVGAPVAAGLRLRVIDDDPKEKVHALRTRVADDVAADIGDLLASGATLHTGGVERAVTAGDVAVLTFSWDQADLVRGALTRAGIHSVVTGAGSVFASPAARHWLDLLRAIERPQHPGALRAAMITPLIGCNGRELALDGDAATDRAAGLVRAWAQDLANAGVAPMLAGIVDETDLYPRLLAQPDGERTITDLLHVAELLHAQARPGPGVSALISWLQEQIGSSEGRSDDNRRRMETEAPAVRLLTIHGSKGLEFPVVYVPFAWNEGRSQDSCAVVFHRDFQRLLDVRGTCANPSWQASVTAAAEEEAGEALRKLYVALTRASCQAVAWWVTSRNTPRGPLHRLLAARIAGQSSCEGSYDLARVTAEGIASLGLHVEPVTDRPTAVAAPRGGDAVELRAAPFDRSIDATWRRTSYTGLTRAVHEAAYQAERVTGERDDEPAEPTDEPAEPLLPQPGAELASPLANLPKGATFGTIVHEVLELMRPSNDLPSELLRCSAEALAHRPLRDVPAERLAAALAPVVTTPLGPLAGGAALWQIPAGDRLSELEFELPLAEGPASGTVLLADVAALLREHLPADDPLAAYAERMVADGLVGTRLLGYLSGSIDAVLRIGSEPRFVVVDYKTNWLGGAQAGALTAGHYQRAAMAREMLAAHYPLQALLYCVALHRYLRWRLPGYDPAVHLGGVQYLFLRGMCGPQTPVAADDSPFGVFSWQPGAALVTALSDRLSGRTS